MWRRVAGEIDETRNGGRRSMQEQALKEQEQVTGPESQLWPLEKEMSGGLFQRNRNSRPQQRIRNVLQTTSYCL